MVRAAALAPEAAASTTDRFTRRDWVWLAVIMLAAFTLRLVYILQWQSSPTFDYPIIDERYHDDWAVAIAEGRSFVDTPFFRAPLYPYFLGAIYALFGHDYLAARIAQAALSTVACGVVFLIGRRLFGRAVGAVAGLVAASYWAWIFFDGELLIPPVIMFLDLVLIWLLIRAHRRLTPWSFGLAGLVLGLSAIGRPNVLLFGPAIVAWILVMLWPRWKRAIACMAAVTAGCLLVVLPVTVRNYVVGNDFVLVASQGGLNFYIGNNPESDGRTATAPGGVMDSPVNYQAAIEHAEQATGRKLKASEVSDYYYRMGWAFIREHPAQALALTWLKVRLFWSKWEIANNRNIYFWTANFAPMLKWLPIGFGLIGPLGIVGLYRSRGRLLELFPLWGFVLVYMASVVPFFCTARYRMPVIPPLILLAVFAIGEGIQTAKERRWKSMAGMAVALVLGSLLVHVTPHTQAREDDLVSHVVVGNVYNDRGQPKAALSHYRRALELAPGDLAAACGLGEVLTTLNRLPEGIPQLRRALSGPRVPRSGETPEMLASTHSSLANALAQTGQYDEAIRHYREAIRLNPRGAKGADQLNLGLVLQALGRNEEAVEVLRQSIEINPEFPIAHLALGRSLLALGRTAEAIPPLRQATAASPRDPQAWFELGRALATEGHTAEAKEALQTSLRLNPRLEEARRLLNSVERQAPRR